MSKFRFLGFILTVSLLAISIFTTCDSPLGMGLPIDWEAPVLTLDPVSNPLYVRNGTVLTGKVTDNVGVDRVIFIDTDGNELFPVTLNGDRFLIELKYTSEYNGKKIVAEIRAYDKMGNSGGSASKFITMIIDIRPPIVEYMEIKRTDTRIAQMQKYSDLLALEGSDRKADLYKYQNGWFYISAIVSDEETKVKITKLEFRDYKNIDRPVLSLDIDDSYTPYFPRWTVKEEDIINAGQAIFGEDYYSDYYNNHARYYYRVVVKAVDMSNNENEVILEDEGFICLWADSDKPKGIVDPAIIGILAEDEAAEVPKNTSLPVDFYDDDSLAWAYAGLLTKDQWDGEAPVCDSSETTIPKTATTTEEKLLWLKEALTGSIGDSTELGGGRDVYDWNFDRNNTKVPIIDQVGGKNIDEKLVYLITSNSSSDYGDYILFTIAADKKLSPHPSTPDAQAVWTNKNNWNGKIVPIKLKDENAPLIVFDTTATPKCPEENTFPEILENGKYFYIVGYTLRENGNGTTFNKVDKFRMAWIPYHIPGGQDAKVTAVQKALSDDKYGKPNALFETDSSLAGIQHWDFDAPGSISVNTPTLGNGLLKLDKYDYTISGSQTKYTRQTFTKRFNVMGDDNDDVKTSTQNFIYNNKLENETKLFIFYALDSMGNEVFRQLPILGFKNNPKIYIYDITNKLESVPTTPSVSTNIPNPTANGMFLETSGAPSPAYYTLLNNYNNYAEVIAALKGATNNLPLIPTEPFQIYPRGTTVKYWVDASDNTIPIATLTMEDITYASDSSAREGVGSTFNTTDKTYSFCEYYPDVTQRTFLFTATDKLGNIKEIQRTVAISNAARLESITTTAQSGTYGENKTITLQANFSSQIYIAKQDGTPITSASEKPVLNIRYKLKGQDYTYKAIECNAPNGNLDLHNPTISLTFDFIVPLNADSDLETVYEGIKDSNSDDRPITLPGTTKIMDSSRKDSAFIPGYSTGSINMPNWTSTNNNALQTKKKITLDGVHPTISVKGLDPSVKAVFTGTNGTTSAERYFKTGESITLTISSEKEIRAFGSSRLQYSIQPSSGAAQTFYTNFKYLKPASPNQLVYSLKVDSTTCPIDGELVSVQLIQNGTSDIIDNYDNNIVNGSTYNLTNLLGSEGKFYIKQTPPPVPATTGGNAATLTNTTSGTAQFGSAPTYYKGSVSLSLPAPATAQNSTWNSIAQYSTNGGITWTPTLPTPLTSSANTAFPLTSPAITEPGPYKIQVRYIDRAGNEGAATEKSIEINNTFPSLVSVNAVEANGWYTTGKNLTFNLNFADTVTVKDTTQANLSITLKNRNTTGDDITIYTDKAVNFSGTTITFKWATITGKEMRDGLYISNVVLTGLSDKFGITGPTGTATWNAGTSTPSVISINSCPNLAAGIKVDAVSPTVNTDGRIPAHDTVPSGSTLVTQITLTFREPVMIGKGVITIRPRGNYAIPPVLEDKGYYLGYNNAAGTAESNDGSGPVPTKYSTYDKNRTYISSLYDIYNSIPSSIPTSSTTGGTPVGTTQAMLRGYLVEGAGSNLSNATESERAGLIKGPYIKMTQGLISGYGYGGNYEGSNVTSGKHAPDLGGAGKYTAMIPDTATKWVLDYKYGITQDISNVNNIRTALTHAKWRWQEIDVVGAKGVNKDTEIPITGSITVTIPLNEPLLKGLEWEVYYPDGTFTDMAGNPAPASGVTNTDPKLWTNTDYFFTSPGVQAPVIRVNRRSYDARTSNWKDPTTATTGGGYDAPGDTTDWGTPLINNPQNTEVTDTTGWGIGDFKYVYYRVESESSAVKQGATVSAQYFQGAATEANQGAAKGAWANGVQAVNYTPADTTKYTDRNWDVAAGNIAGEWVLPNIVRRSRNGTNQTYVITTKNDTLEARTSAGTLRMFKSYNRDRTAAELGFPNPSDTGTGLVSATLSASAKTKGQGFLSFTDYEASKSYVVGTALCNGATAKGVEGVFRTVIMLNYSTSRNSNYIAVEGSNIKNGMPSIAGFPVRDADERDSRYIKIFYNETSGTARTRFYWVSTEIVSEWYFLSWGRTQANNANGTHQTTGEVNNYMMVGYGDLTYGYNVTRSGTGG